ncbi:hypothetical protein LG311_02605 [Sutcliffiella horikoshii]|uniref:hypothetical protein n=1 Tax=Sutcliffiella horikoshii TaxID=79883 RepID=UPI00384EB878
MFNRRYFGKALLIVLLTSLISNWVIIGALFIESHASEEFMTSMVYTVLFFAPFLHVITLILSFILLLIGDTLTKSWTTQSRVLLFKFLLYLVPVGIIILWMGNGFVLLVPSLILFFMEIALKKVTTLRYLGFATLALYMLHLLLIICTLGIIVLIAASS